MAGTRRLYGSLGPIGHRGALLKPGADGGIDVPIADADEMAKAFGLTDQPPKGAAKVAPPEPKPAPEPPAEEAETETKAADEKQAPPVVLQPVPPARPSGRGGRG